jgi:hypothetical protein
VPFSIELEGDYEGLLTELGRLIADAKDVLESDAFSNRFAANNARSASSRRPAAPGGSRKASGGASTIVTAGLYSLIRGLPARFSANGALSAWEDLTFLPQHPHSTARNVRCSSQSIRSSPKARLSRWPQYAPIR